MTAAVTRTYYFSASHRLHSNAFSDADNVRIFGKCNNPFGHGHNYELEITARGPIGQHTGLVVSIERLDRYVRSRVLRDFDAVNMNVDIPEFQDAIPTTENVTRVIAARLASVWDNEFGRGGPKLARVHVQETARNGFELIVENGKPTTESESRRILL